MRKKFLAAGALAAVMALVAVAGLALVPSSGIRPIAADAACPAVGCASGACHGFDAVPEPDGVHELVCPEAGCASAECHAWDSLVGRYHQASDMSLNMWILMPTVLALGLWLLVRRADRGKRARVDDDAIAAPAGADEAAVPGAAILGRRSAGGARHEASDEEVCHEA